MSGKSRAVVALVAAGAVAVIAGVAVVIGSSASGAADLKSRTNGPDPAGVTVHRSTQDPDQVRRYWTPERLKQANDNTRSRPGSQF